MSKWLLLIGIVCGVVAAIMVNLHLGSMEAQQESLSFVRLEASTPLNTGDAVTSKDMLVEERLPKSFESLTKIAIPWTPETLMWLKNRRVTSSVGPGEFLTYAHFSSDASDRFAGTIATGMRAVSLPVSGDSAVSYFVEPGSRVDILATLEYEAPVAIQSQVAAAVAAAEDPAADQSQPPPTIAITDSIRRVVTKTVLQNVKVLAVGDASAHQDYLAVREDGYTTVTVELGPADAETLVAVLQQTRAVLMLTLRAPGDDAVVDTPDVDIDDLLGVSGR